MAVTMSEQATYPEETRRKSARVLAALVGLQAIAALGGLAWILSSGADVAPFVIAYFFFVGILSVLAAGVEWMRLRIAEAVVTLAVALSFGLTLTAVLSGQWRVVPFVGLTTIASIFGLVERFTVRDEMRHQPKH